MNEDTIPRAALEAVIAALEKRRSKAAYYYRNYAPESILFQQKQSEELALICALDMLSALLNQEAQS